MKSGASPADDLISQLVAVEAEGTRLTEQELVSTCVQMLGAGHETTTSLIGNGLYLILSHPHQWQETSPESIALEFGDRRDSSLRKPCRPPASTH